MTQHTIKQAPSMQALTVVDLGLGMPSALLVKMFGGLGATVARFAPTGGDPLEAAQPYQADWRRQAVRPDAAELADWLARADVIVTGGEDHPAVTHADPAELAQRHPRAVVVHIEGYPADHPAAGRPAVDLLVQARSGIANEIVDGRPVHLTFAAPSFGAAFQGMVGALAALVERTRSGAGQIVTTSLQQGTLHFLPFWMTPSRPAPSFGRTIPKGTVPLLFRCSDGRWLHFGTGARPEKAYEVLGIEVPDTPHPNWFGDPEAMGAAIAKMTSEQALKVLLEGGMAVELVRDPGEMWDHPQAVANGIIEEHAGVRSVAQPLNFASTEVAPADRRESATDSEAGTGNGPLAGLRFIDFGHFVAGPYATKLLADLGADVVKVETTHGEIMRDRSFSAYLSVNRGKRTLAINAKDPRGREIIGRLSGRMNGTSHNFRPGVAERLGLDGATLRSTQPDLFTLHSSAYGNTGPKAKDPGFDPIIQACTGLEVRAGGAGDPLWYRLLTVDYSAGLLGAIAMLVGVLEQQDGRAVDIDFNLLDTGLFLLSELMQDTEGTFFGARSTNAERTGYQPTEALYRTSDGWVAVAAPSDDMVERLLAWAETDRADFDTLGRAFAARTTAAALAELAEAEVWAEEAVADGWAELRAAGSPVVSTLHDADKGDILLTGATVSFSRSGVVDTPSAPLLGSATHEILTELGYAPEVIEDLYALGIVTDHEHGPVKQLQEAR